jgi:hypothetical protein
LLSALHCTALHCTALANITISTALHWQTLLSALHCTALANITVSTAVLKQQMRNKNAEAAVQKFKTIQAALMEVMAIFNSSYLLRALLR